jgi:hypothetical protein
MDTFGEKLKNEKNIFLNNSENDIEFHFSNLKCDIRIDEVPCRWKKSSPRWPNKENDKLFCF